MTNPNSQNRKLIIISIQLCILFSVFINFSNAAGPDEDSFLTVPQLCTKYGYAIETHRIQTSDGYLLTAHRIPYGKKSPKTTLPKRVVYLGHGLTASSACWVTNYSEMNWGYLLADAGYDVWMVNNRGNFYSRSHVSLSPSKSDFWNFTLTEMGTRDFIASVDYILAQTEVPDLYYIGHSMGTTSVLIGTSVYPEYNKKIRISVLLAPTAFCTHMRSPIKYLAPLEGIATNLLQGLSHNVPLGELNPNSYFLSLFKSFSCNVDIIYTMICQNLYFLLFGFDTHQISRERIPVYVGHLPAGSSVYAELHYGQLANSGRFCEYDYGFDKNPPRDFDLTNVNHKVALFWGDNDWLADPKDVLRLTKFLPNIVANVQVKYKGFTHVDFIFGTKIVPLVIDPVIKLLEAY